MNIRYKGFTYSVYIRPWLKGHKKYEIIKYETGYRNLWDRISLADYNLVLVAKGLTPLK